MILPKTDRNRVFTQSRPSAAAQSLSPLQPFNPARSPYRPFNRRHQIYTPELRVCCSWSRSRHCRRWALGDGFTESPPRRSAPTCRPGRRRVIGHTGIPQFETPDPVSPWLQNLVTKRSPGTITVSFPREGLITCKSTPRVSPGVTAKL